MLLMRFQVEGPVIFETLKVSIVGMTSVAFEHVSHEEIEGHIDHGRGKKNRVGGDDVVQVPGNATGQEADGDNGDAQSLRKVFADEKLLARAEEATLKPASLNGALGSRC